MGGSRRRQSKGKRIADGPKYPARLLKELGDSNDGRFGKAKIDDEDEGEARNDVYEYEEREAEEEAGKNRRFDDVEKMEYELPPDFEDEEIDEDAAFGDEGRSGGDLDTGEVYSDEAEEGSDDDMQGEDVDEDEEDEDEDEDERYNMMIEEVTGKSKQEKKRDEVVTSNLDAERNGSISVDDLLTPLQEKPGFNALKKRMRDLQKRTAPTPAPLPSVLQEKLDRKAGYEKTRQEVSKWQPLVKRNREAPTVNFIDRVDVTLNSVGSLAAHFQPTTSFEKEVAAVLREGGVSDPRDVESAETLELNKLSVEEVRDRQERLAKMRSLLFRHEERAKRVKKIKSKTFHRLLRKSENSKAVLLLNDPELQKEEALKQEFKRAQERMTLKHKNTSKWAKRILKRGLQQRDDGTRNAISEQLRDHHLLTRKIHSATADSSENESSEEDSDVEGEANGLVLDRKPGSKVLAKAKVAALKILEGDNEAEIPANGLFSLPFMVRGIEKKRKQAESDAEALLEDLERVEEGDDANTAQDDEIATGRRSFGGVAARKMKAAVEEHERIERATDSEESDDDVGVPRIKRKLNKERPTQAKVKQSEEDKGLDDRLAVHTTKVDGPISVEKAVHTTKKKKKRKIEAVEADGNPIKALDNKSIKKSKKRSKTTPSSLVASEEDVENEQLRKKNKKKTKKKNKNKKKADALSAINSNPTIFGDVKKDAVSEAERNKESVSIAVGSNKEGSAEQVNEQDASNKVKVEGLLSQKDLIREAFAGDDVESEFAKLKADAAGEEGPKGEEILDLPGWGQWTSVQKKKGPPQWMIAEQEELKKKKEAALTKRQDAKLTNVIISEKIDKKASRLFSSSLPFPYTSKEVFEATIRMPIGRDFNTHHAFQSLTKPSVIKSAGVIINPIKYEKSPPAATKDRKHL